MTDKETKPTKTRDAGAIVWMDPHSLIPYENNPRKNDKAVAAVAASIKEFGFNVPITVDENLVVATGHTRLKAALKLGMGKVPVIVLKGLSESQIKAWRLADNKTAELATWDEDKLNLEIKGITGIDLSSFGFKASGDMSEVEEDDFDESLPEEPKAKLGDIYILGNNRLMCGDSLKKEDMDHLMNGETADLVMTDPPYNVDYEGEAGKILNDQMSTSQWRSFLQSAIEEMRDNLKQGGGNLSLEPELVRNGSHGSRWHQGQRDPYLEQIPVHDGPPRLPMET